MKRVFLILALLSASIWGMAQSHPNEYRNLTAMHIWMSNCEKAKQCYDIHKELSGQSLEKLDVLIAKTCGSKDVSNYSISFDKNALLNYLEKEDFEDKELILRVLSWYSDPQEMAVQLRKLESVYTTLAKKISGEAWYESISVQKKL